MIPPIKKIPSFLFSVILLLLLCNTSTAFATGSIPIPVPSSQGGAGPEQKLSVSGGQTEAVPPEQEPPVDGIVWKEAATIDELACLLDDADWINAGGHIRVTDDLVLLADDYCMIWPDTTEEMPLVVDMGGHTLYVEGWLRSFGHIKYIGAGGKNGLIRVRTGGRANIRSAVFTVTEEGGYAIWQENESVLSYEPAAGSVGEIRFAQTLAGEASTFEELMLLLEDEYWKANGGYITVTDNLVVPAGEEHKIGWLDSKALTTVDMGRHTLSVKGTLGVYGKVKIIGMGGENGLLRVKTGGEASVKSAVLIAEEGGYAAW